MLNKKNIWLDVDPGHDDAFAMILACHHPELNILGISTACGNQTIEKTTENALKILQICNIRNIEVVAGQPHPLIEDRLLTCPEIHGDTGLDGTNFPTLDLSPFTDEKAVIYMAKKIMECKDGKVTIIATACLTNIALLLTLYPEIKDRVDIVFMGGAMGFGNTNPAAEFNMQVDPEASKIVLESGVENITMIPLEVTHTALVTEDILNRLKTMNSKFSQIMIELLLFFKETYKNVFKFEDPPLHDPCAVAYVIDPTLFQCEKMRVDVETSSVLSPGQTICDIYNLRNRRKNVNVAKEMNVPIFWDLMMEAIRKANQNSPIN